MEEWRGSLLQQQVDKSGYLYQRNRYYDPTTGRFTQVDPIGIAGGVNVYGFADGDPVNFADPFGLDCKNNPNGPECQLIRGVSRGVRDKAYEAAGNYAGLALSGGLSRLLGKAAGAVGKWLGGGTAAATGATADEMVEVIHYTSAEGAAQIEASGSLRSGSYVALAEEVAGADAAAAEMKLEIDAGKGAMSGRFQVPRSTLQVPRNGSTTSGGSTQFQLTQPVAAPRGTFKPTPN